MKKVLVAHGEKGELAKIFQVSLVTVRDALNGKTHSELAARIRQAAIRRGGMEQAEKVKADEV